ncbi:MAG: hypothetical protein AAGI51_18635, partial [Pseudomonadota bacterium]
MTRLKPETLDALADLAWGCALLAAKSAGLPDPSPAFDLFRQGRAALASLADDGRGDAGVALRFRATLSAEWRDWGRLGELPQTARDKAVNDADVALPLVLPPPKEVVAQDFDARALADRALAVAARDLPVAYADRGPAHAETWHSRRFLHALIERTCAELIGSPDWFEAITPELWKAALPALHRVEAKQDAALAKQDESNERLGRVEEMVAALLARAPDRPLAEAEINQGLAALPEAVRADEAALANLLRILLKRDDIRPDQYAAALAAAEREAEKLMERVERLPNRLPEEIRDLKQEARRAVESRDIDRARDVLREAHAAQRAAREQAAEDEAETLADLAAVEAADLDYRAAAALYAEAAQVPGLPETARWRWQERRATVLQDYGREFGDNQALQDSITLYQSTVLPLAPRAARP